MPQAAYDIDSPNGSSRLPQGDRVVAVFRLYRKLGTNLDVQTEAQAASPLGAVRDVLRDGRRLIRENLSALQQGRVLEREFKFVLLLDSIECTPEVRTSFHYVRDGYFIDTPQQNAKGVTRFRLVGRTFWTPVYVNGVPVDGDSALKDFQELVDDYFFPGDGTSAADYELYWFNYLAAISAEDPFGEFEWLIHPVKHGVQSRQVAQRPWLRAFSFDFLGLRSNRDLAKAEDGFLAGLMEAGFLAELLDELGLGVIVDALKDVYGTVAELQAFLDDVNNAVTAVSDYITGASQWIQFSFAKTRGLLTTTQSIIGQIEDAVDAVRDFPNLIDDQIRLLQQSVPGIVSDESNGTIAAGELRRLYDFLAAVIVQQSAFSPTLNRAPSQTIALEVQVGATLERLARDVGVDPATLIDVNDLLHPFLDSRVRTEAIAAAADAAVARADAPGEDLASALRAVAAQADRAVAGIRTHGTAIAPEISTAFDVAAAAAHAALGRVRAGGPGLTVGERAALQVAATAAQTVAAEQPSRASVIYAGDLIQIPQARTDLVPSVVGSAGNFIAARSVPLTEEERLLGVDLLLNRAGNLEWDETTRDLKLSRGLDNMARVQDRYVRLPLGALPFAPLIGNFYTAESLGIWQTPGTTRLGAYAMWRTVNQDPRVRRVRRVQVRAGAGAVHLSYSAEIINGKDVPRLKAEFPAAVVA